MNSYLNHNKLEHFTDEEGRIDYKLPERGGLWVAPEVTLENEYLKFSLNWPDNVPENYHNLDGGYSSLLRAGWKVIEVPDASKFLARFHRLKSQVSILKFARDFGPLFICNEHNNLLSPNPITFKGCCWSDNCSWETQEPLSVWLFAVEQVRAVLEAVKALQEGKTVPQGLWEKLGYSGNQGILIIDGGINLDDQKDAISELINDRIKSVGFNLSWKHDVTLDVRWGNGVWQAIWFQVALAVTRSRGIHVCSGCNEIYIRTGRAAPKGRENYCKQCQKIGAKKNTYYRKKKIIKITPIP